MVVQIISFFFTNVYWFHQNTYQFDGPHEFQLIRQCIAKYV